MDRNNFIFWKDWSQALRQLPPDIELEARHALEDYAYGGVEYTGDNIAVKMFFALVKSAIDRQVQSYENICERNRANGAKGGRPRKEQEPRETQENPNNPVGFLETQENPAKPKKPYTDTKTITITDTDIFNENNNIILEKDYKKKKFDFCQRLVSLGVSGQTAQDYIRVRRAKKAPETETALNGLVREAKKASVTLQEAITISVERNWVGFKADWLIREKSNGNKQDNSGLRLDRDTMCTGDFKTEW